MEARPSRLEEQARSVERSISAKASDNAALEATIKSAELYLQALRLAGKPADRKRLDAKFNELISQAERLKSSRDRKARFLPKEGSIEPLKAPISTRPLTTRENIILLEGAKLNGFVFKPWTNAPSSEEFSLREGESPFTDPSRLPLSASQLESFDGWKRPHEALSSVNNAAGSQEGTGAAVMHLAEAMDLVQDMTSDCSVVASLCALTSRVERGHPKVLQSVVHPFDHENNRMVLSPNGKYIFKLNFNGCWRRVEIDDYLPASKTGRVLHVIDRRHPRLLWPALIEKAYLKVRGGYDFPGSNSGTDLAVLTGWIPQQIFLHDEDVEPDHLWEELVNNFEKGHVLITIGTGKLPRREQRHLGLAAEHDYAVLDISSDADSKEMLVKNPWADGDVWRGATRRKPHRNDDSTTDIASASDGMMPGTFWMDFNRVFQYFEHMYLNWNPGLFSHRQDLHFSWDQGGSSPKDNLFIDSPQFAVTASEAGEIWLLLHRHFRTGDYTQATTTKNGYISLYLYACNGNRVISSEGAKIRGPFVDSPNTLLRIKASAKTTYSAVLVSQDLPPGKLNFTISAFSKSAVTLLEAKLQYSRKYSLESGWTRSNAGGNSDSPKYLSNPQFQMSLPSSQKIALVLRVADQDESANRSIHASATRASSDAINVKILVVFSDGSRITRLRPRDVLAHSGDYRRGSAVMEAELGRGCYTVICSTFDQDQYAEFSLDLYSSSAGAPASLVSLPADVSGRLSIKSTPAVFTDGTNRLLAPLTLLRMTRVTLVAHHDITATQAQSSLYKMTLEQGQGPYKEIIASSQIDDEEFRAVSSGLRIGDLDLQPSMCGPGTGGLWVVLERLAQGRAAERADVLGVEMFADERVELGVWGLGDG